MSPPRFVHKRITGSDLDSELTRYGMTRKTFARIFCQNLVTVNRWGRNGQDVPTWVPIALTMLTLPNAIGTVRMAAAAMIEQDRLRPELGAFPYQKLRTLPEDSEKD
jgi:hypothetical protein